MMQDQSVPLFRPLADENLSHSKHLLAATSNPEIFVMLSGHEQKIATAVALTVRMFCDSKTSTFMAGDKDCIDSWMEPSNCPHHLSLTRAVARKLGQATEHGAQDQSLHDMTIEIAGDIARQATAANILHAHRSGIKVNSAYDTMISYLAHKEGALEEVEREAAGNYSQLGPEAQLQAWDSIKAGEDITFDFEPLLDKSLTAIKTMSDPLMALNDELPDNSPPNLLIAAQILSGRPGDYPVVLRGLNVVESFVDNSKLDGMADHYKLQAVARMVGLAHDSENQGRKVTEEMAARTMLADVRIMHDANLRIKGSSLMAANQNNALLFRGDYAELTGNVRARVFRTLDLGTNIAPEEKIEIHARCVAIREQERAKGYMLGQSLQRGASIAL